MTGITRVSKESIFSDLNNLKVVTVTSDEYATSFGFTEEEVFAALEECGLETEKGNKKAKTSFEVLLKGESIYCPIDEQIVYNQLGGSEAAIWSLLLASGYLKAINHERPEQIASGKKPMYEVALTNHEVKYMFLGMVQEWFYQVEDDYSDFIKALMLGNKKAMNTYMNRLTVQIFSYFDTGKGTFGDEPERFYHGFVLGLLAELNGRYVITSNRESGFGRYDVMLEPQNPEDKAYILEFKVHDKEDEESLKETVEAALQQIDEKQYETVLIAKGISKDRIYKYGFAFEGKKVLIG